MEPEHEVPCAQSDQSPSLLYPDNSDEQYSLNIGSHNRSIASVLALDEEFVLETSMEPRTLLSSVTGDILVASI